MSLRKLAPLLVPILAQAQPAPRTFTLPNGLKVQLFEDHSLPLLRGELRLALPAPAEDPEAWLRPLAFRMLAAGGSGSRSAAAFAQASDAIGLDLRASQAPDAAAWTFSARSQDQETAMALLADRVTRPAFDGLALEAARAEAWSALSDPNALTRARLRFADSLAALPEPDDRALGGIDASDLGRWHRRLFRPDRATLVLWGDLDTAQARQLVLLSFGAWPAQEAAGVQSLAAAPNPGPFIAALPGEAPSVAVGLVEDGADAARRRFLRPWVELQLRAGGLAVAETERGATAISLAAPLGASAETLRARIAAALDALPASLTAADLASIQAQEAGARPLLSLHPARLVSAAADPALAPASLDEARATLARWCAPANRRLFASGDPGALGGLQTAPQTSTPKR